MMPIGRCEERHGMKRDIGHLFCVDCGTMVGDAQTAPPAPPAPRELDADDATEGARILPFPVPVPA